MTTTKNTRKPAAKSAPKFQTIERPASKRGRKSIEKPGMADLVTNWKDFPIGATIVLPDNSGSSEHKDVTLDRYHFRKVAKAANLTPGTDYTIESHPDHGAIITRLA